jgi:hypothetical protein
LFAPARDHIAMRKRKGEGVVNRHQRRCAWRKPHTVPGIPDGCVAQIRERIGGDDAVAVFLAQRGFAALARNQNDFGFTSPMQRAQRLADDASHAPAIRGKVVRVYRKDHFANCGAAVMRISESPLNAACVAMFVHALPVRA